MSVTYSFLSYGWLGLSGGVIFYIDRVNLPCNCLFHRQLDYYVGRFKLRPYFLRCLLHRIWRLLRVLSRMLFFLQNLHIYVHRLCLWWLFRRRDRQVLNRSGQLNRIYLTRRQLRSLSHSFKIWSTRMQGVLLGGRHSNAVCGVRLMLFELFVSVHAMKRELFDNCKNVTLVLFYLEKELIELQIW